MKNLIFWLRWQAAYRNLYFIFLGLLIISSIGILVGRWIGVETAISWVNLAEIQSMPVAMDNFNKGIINFNVEANSYLVYQQYVGSDVILHKWYAYVFLLILITCYSVYMGAISTLKNNIYYILASLNIGFFILLKPELLQSIGYNSNLFLGFTILIFNGLSYYLVTKKRSMKVFTSITLFFIVSLLYFGTLILTSKVQEPVFQLVNNGMWAPIAITVILIFMVAFDNVHVILYLLTANSNAGSQGTGVNFIIVNLLYLINILLVYLKRTFIIDWNILYIDIFVIFLLAVYSGIWGFRKRTNFINSIPFEPIGALVYISMATLGLSTIFYHIMIANSALVNSFENMIIYTQLSFGIMFVFYILVNFGIYLFRNQKVHLIVYKEGRLPYFIVPAIGLVFTAALFMRGNMAVYEQAMAGYYNGVADACMVTENYVEAELYYKKATKIDYRNFRGQYSLGCLMRGLSNPEKAIEYFEKANVLYENNELAVVNAAFEMNKKQDFFGALEALREARIIFPKSARVANNLALMFKKTDLADSTIAYFSLARKHSSEEEVPLANLLAYGIEKSEGEVNEGMISDLNDNSGNKALEINKLYIYNRLNKTYPHPIKINENQPSNEDFALYFNAELNKVKNADTNDITLINKLLKLDTLSAFSDDLKFLRASIYYYNGVKNKGLTEMYELVHNANQGNAPMYANSLGLWLLKEDAPGIAADFFKKSLLLQNQSARLNYALALTENMDFKTAEDEWSVLKVSQENTDYTFANAIKPVIYSAIDVNKKDWTDDMKCYFLHFRSNELSSTDMLPIVETVKDPSLKVYAATEWMKALLREGNFAQVERVYNKISALKINDKHLLQALTQLYGFALLKQNKTNELSKVLKNNVLNNEQRIFLEAFLASKNKKTKEANLLFLQAIEQNPFNAEINIAAAEFFNNTLKNSQKAYDILANAINNNPKSIPLYEAYTLQAIRAGLYKFAEQALVSIQNYVSPQEFARFKVLYDKELQITNPE